MVCDAYFGEISEKCKMIWENAEVHPIEVLHEPIRLEDKGHEVLMYGSKYFNDEIQIDWGSFAWKCSPEQIYTFLDEHKCTLSWLLEGEDELIQIVKQYIERKEQTEYGVLFVEWC